MLLLTLPCFCYQKPDEGQHRQISYAEHQCWNRKLKKKGIRFEGQYQNDGNIFTLKIARAKITVTRCS